MRLRELDWFKVLALLLLFALFAFLVPAVHAQTVSFSQSYTNGSPTVYTFSAQGTVAFNSFDYVTGKWHFVVSAQSTGDSGVPNEGFCNASFAGASSGNTPIGNTNLLSAAGEASPGAQTLTISLGLHAGGFNASPTSASISVTVPAALVTPRSMLVPEVNNQTVPLLFTYKDALTGKVIGTDLVQPGQTSNFALTNSTGDDIDVRASSPNYTWNATTGMWMELDGIDETEATTVLKFANFPPATGNVSDVPGTGGTNAGITGSSGTVANSLGQAANGSNSGTSAGSTTTVIYQPGTSVGQTGNTGALQGGDFDSGINGLAKVIGTGLSSVVNAVDSSSSSGGGGSSSVSVSNMPSNFPDATADAELASLNTTATAIKTDTDAMKLDEDGMKSDLDSTYSLLHAGSSYDGGGSEISSVTGSAATAVSGTSWGTGIGPSNQGTVGSFTVPTTGPSDPTMPANPPGSLFTMPTTLSFDPSGQLWSSADTLLTNARSLIAIALVVWFASSCGGIMQAYVVGLMNAPQVRGLDGVENLVPGVPLTKNVALAVAITAVAAAGIAAILTVINGDLASSGAPLSTLTALTGARDLSGLGGGVALVNRYFPCALALELGVLRAGVAYATAPVYAAAAATIRFLNV